MQEAYDVRMEIEKAIQRSNSEGIYEGLLQPPIDARRVVVLAIYSANGDGDRMEHVGIGFTRLEAIKSYLHGPFYQIVIDELSNVNPGDAPVYERMFTLITETWKRYPEEVWSEVCDFIRGWGSVVTIASIPMGSGAPIPHVYADDHEILRFRKFHSNSRVTVYRQRKG